jgi:hypothetical protein
MIVYEENSSAQDKKLSPYYKLIAGFQDGYVKIIDLKE